MRLFQNRHAAAQELARHLGFLKNEDPIVLGLANGGVPIAEVIASSLDAPLDVLIIERLSAPKNAKHIVGAVDEHGRISMIRSTARWHHLTSREMIDPARDVFRQIQRRRGRIRAILPEMDLRGRVVIIVSQGVASGAKILGAIASARDNGARKVVVASPAGSGEAAWQLHEAADVVVIPHRPAKFESVEQLYQEFSIVTDDLVEAIVQRWVESRPPQAPGVSTILMKLNNDLGQLLCCEVDLPPGMSRDSGPFPAVIFAHGFESDGRNPRTAPVSRRLAKRGIIGVRANFTGHGRSEGQLEDATHERLQADLKLILDAVRYLNEVDEDCIGFVGSGSGSALVLERTQSEPCVRGVVVRGPMLGPELDLVMGVVAPTLLIFSEQEQEFSAALHARRSRLPSIHETLEIPGAARLFNDAISLEMMVSASVDWLVDHLSPLIGAVDPEVAPGEESRIETPR